MKIVNWIQIITNQDEILKDFHQEFQIKLKAAKN